MEERIIALRQSFQQDLAHASSKKDLELLQGKYLGKKGPIQELMQELRSVSASDRPHFGKKINDLKEECTRICTEALEGFHLKELAERLENETIDVTLPGRRRFLGRVHPITRMLHEVIDVLTGMGFSVQYGPDIDSEYYNFDALNYPKDHPARDMQDTFYISEDLLLRSQTSNVQVRVMETHKPPLRIIAPGTVYRNENISSRSHVFFHQLEGIYIDEGVSLADLLATMNEFLAKLFQESVETRFRPSFFPFVEPGIEVDVRCTACQGQGCRLCKQAGWLEILGAGMVHPEVLKSGGVDPEIYSGYAWGMGIERLALLRYAVTDIRLFSENDLRFLAQFSR